MKSSDTNRPVGSVALLVCLVIVLTTTRGHAQKRECDCDSRKQYSHLGLGPHGMEHNCRLSQRQRHSRSSPLLPLERRHEALQGDEGSTRQRLDQTMAGEQNWPVGSRRENV